MKISLLIAGIGGLLGDVAHWTKGALARNAQGHVVDVDDASACCWSLTGAALHVVAPLAAREPELAAALVRSALRRITPWRYLGDAEAFNDAASFQRITSAIIWARRRARWTGR